MFNVQRFNVVNQQEPNRFQYSLEGKMGAVRIKIFARNELINELTTVKSAPDPIADKLYATVCRTYNFFECMFHYKGSDGEGTFVPFTIRCNGKGWQFVGGESRKPRPFKFDDCFFDQAVTREWTYSLINRLCALNKVGEASALREALGDIMAVTCAIWINDCDITKKSVWLADSGYNLMDHAHYCTDPECGNAIGNATDSQEKKRHIVSHAFYDAVHAHMHKTHDQIEALDGVVGIIWKTMLKMKPEETLSGFARKAIETANEQSSALGESFQEAFGRVNIVPAPQAPEGKAPDEEACPLKPPMKA